MKKNIILLLSFLCFHLSALAFNENSLDEIEMARYGRVYSEEDLGSRLRKLETDYFGMAQSGNIDKRIAMLKQFAQSDSVVPITPFDDGFYYDKKPNALKRFLNNVSSTFDTTGVITGYTPPITNNIYPNNIYRREYMNFLNNNNNFCPYHNTYHPNKTKRFPNHFHNRENTHANNFFNRYRNSLRNSYNYPYSYPSYNRYIPSDAMTNVSTRSTVHILQD